LGEEGATTLCLSHFSDQPRQSGQARETAQESSVRLVLPAHITRTAPPVLPQRIESAVVTDAVGHVRLEIVSRAVPVGSPREQRRGVGDDDLADCRSSHLALRSVIEGLERLA